MNLGNPCHSDCHTKSMDSGCFTVSLVMVSCSTSMNVLSSIESIGGRLWRSGCGFSSSMVCRLSIHGLARRAYAWRCYRYIGLREISCRVGWCFFCLADNSVPHSRRFHPCRRESNYSYHLYFPIVLIDLAGIFWWRAIVSWMVAYERVWCLDLCSCQSTTNHWWTVCARSTAETKTDDKVSFGWSFWWKSE